MRKEEIFCGLLFVDCDCVLLTEYFCRSSVKGSRLPYVFDFHPFADINRTLGESPQ